MCAQDQIIDVSQTNAKHFDWQRVEIDREVNRRSGMHMGEERSRAPGELGSGYPGRCAGSCLQSVRAYLEDR